MNPKPEPIIHSITDNGLPNMPGSFSGNGQNPFSKPISIIYGNNSAGKTSIARALQEVDKSKIADGVKVHDGIDLNTKVIKVFSEDFINNNLYFEKLDEGQYAEIPLISVQLGEKGVTAQKEIKRIKNIQEVHNKQHPKEIKGIESAWSAWAKIIRDSLLQLGLEKYSRYDIRYIKGHIDNLNKKIIENSWNPVDDIGKRIEKLKKIITEETKHPLPLFNQRNDVLNKISMHNLLHSLKSVNSSIIQNTEKNDWQKLSEIINIILKDSVAQKIVGAIHSDPTIVSWISEGLSIHTTGGKKDNCFFCGKDLSDDRVAKLENYFDSAYKNLESDIDYLIHNIPLYIINTEELRRVFTENEFYQNYWGEYQKGIEELVNEVGILNDHLHKALALLKDKKNKMTQKVDNLVIPQNINIPDKVAKLNSAITDNNEYTAKQDITQKSAVTEIIELQIFMNQWHTSYTKNQKRIAEIRKDKNDLITKIGVLREDLESAYKETNQESIDRLNKHLEHFFENERVRFNMSPIGKCYTIQRGDAPAKRLSRGEKNAIALIYFLDTLHDEELNRSDICVVLDDPIASFDHEKFEKIYSIIHTEILMNETIPGQVIILTHDIKLLRQLRRNIKPDNGGIYYHIKNSSDNSTALLKMDRGFFITISLYCKLFALVNDLYSKKDNLNPLEESAALNIIRRFIESFFDFYFPNHWPLMDKLNELLQNQNLPPSSIKEIEMILQGGSHSYNSDTTPPIILEKIMSGIETRYPGHHKYMQQITKLISQEDMNIYQKEIPNTQPLDNSYSEDDSNQDMKTH